MNKPKMAEFSKLKLLFILKQNFNGGQFYNGISKLGYFKKLEKVWKIEVAKEIGCKNDRVLSKIELRQKIDRW